MFFFLTHLRLGKNSVILNYDLPSVKVPSLLWLQETGLDFVEVDPILQEVEIEIEYNPSCKLHVDGNSSLFM